MGASEAAKLHAAMARQILRPNRNTNEDAALLQCVSMKQLPRNAGGKVHVRVRVRRLVHFVVAAAAAAATIPATGTQPHAAAVVEGREQPALPACLHSSLSQTHRLVEQTQ